MSHLRELRKEAHVILPTTGEKYKSPDGTVSMVLEEQLDTAYEPTEEEVQDFADWIGMKLPEDEEYLWIAREGLKTPLPKEWKPCQTDSGEIYYYNFKTGDSVWEHPMDEHVKNKFVEEKARRTKLRESGVVITDAREKIPQRNHIIFSESGIIRAETEPLPVTVGVSSKTQASSSSPSSNSATPPSSSVAVASAPSSALLPPSTASHAKAQPTTATTTTSTSNATTATASPKSATTTSSSTTASAAATPKAATVKALEKTGITAVMKESPASPLSGSAPKSIPSFVVSQKNAAAASASSATTTTTAGVSAMQNKTNTAPTSSLLKPSATITSSPALSGAGGAGAALPVPSSSIMVKAKQDSNNNIAHTNSHAGTAGDGGAGRQHSVSFTGNSILATGTSTAGPTSSLLSSYMSGPSPTTASTATTTSSLLAGGGNSAPGTIISAMTGKPIAVGGTSLGATSILASSSTPGGSGGQTTTSSLLATKSAPSTGPTGSLLGSTYGSSQLGASAAPASAMKSATGTTGSASPSVSLLASSAVKAAVAASGSTYSTIPPPPPLSIMKTDGNGSGGTGVGATGSILGLASTTAPTTTSSPSPSILKTTQSPPLSVQDPSLRSASAQSTASSTTASPTTAYGAARTASSESVGSVGVGGAGVGGSSWSTAAVSSPVISSPSTAPTKRFASEAEQQLEANVRNELEAAHRAEVERMIADHKQKIAQLEIAHEHALHALQVEMETKRAEEMAFCEADRQQLLEKHKARIEKEMKAKLSETEAVVAETEKKILETSTAFEEKLQKEVKDMEAKRSAEETRKTRELEEQLAREKQDIKSRMGAARRDMMQNVEQTHRAEVSRCVAERRQTIDTRTNAIREHHNETIRKMREDAARVLEDELRAMSASTEREFEERLGALTASMKDRCDAVEKKSIADQQRVREKLEAELRDEEALQDKRDNEKRQELAQRNASELTAKRQTDQAQKDAAEQQKRRCAEAEARLEAQRKDLERRRDEQRQQRASRIAEKEKELKDADARIEAEVKRRAEGEKAAAVQRASALAADAMTAKEAELRRREAQLEEELERSFSRSAQLNESQAIEEAVKQDFEAFVAREEAQRRARLHDYATTCETLESQAKAAVLAQLKDEQESRSATDAAPVVTHLPATADDVRERCRSPLRRATAAVDAEFREKEARSEAELRREMASRLRDQLNRVEEETKLYERDERDRILAESNTANPPSSSQQRHRKVRQPARDRTRAKQDRVSLDELQLRLESVQVEFETKTRELRKRFQNATAAASARKAATSAGTPLVGATGSPAPTSNDAASYLNDRKQMLLERRETLERARQEWEIDMQRANQAVQANTSAWYPPSGIASPMPYDRIGGVGGGQSVMVEGYDVYNSSQISPATAESFAAINAAAPSRGPPLHVLPQPVAGSTGMPALQLAQLLQQAGRDLERREHELSAEYQRLGMLEHVPPAEWMQPRSSSYPVVPVATVATPYAGNTSTVHADPNANQHLLRVVGKLSDRLEELSAIVTDHDDTTAQRRHAKQPSKAHSSKEQQQKPQRSHKGR